MQISKIDVLPVTEARHLRAESKKEDLPVTESCIYGQISKIDVLPVTESCILRADSKNRCFARNRGEAFTGRIKKKRICP